MMAVAGAVGLVLPYRKDMTYAGARESVIAFLSLACDALTTVAVSRHLPQTRIRPTVGL